MISLWSLVFGLSVLAAALVGLITVAQLVVGQPMIGAALCLAPATWIYGGNWDIAVADVAGLTFYVSDLVAVVLVVAAFIQLSGFEDWAWPLAGVTALVGLALLQGMAIFGPSFAVNGARSSIYLVAAVWWAVTVDWSKQDIGKAALVAGWFFVALALLHLLLYGFATVDTEGQENAVDASYRLLNAHQALLLALCTAIVIFDQKRRQLISVAVFTTVVIAAQNRSAWIAFIGGFVAVALLSADSGRRRRALGPLTIAGLVAALVLTGILAGSIGSKLTTAATETVTWNWRLQSWQGLLNTWLSGDLMGITFGQPFGRDFSRLIDGRATTLSAHNWYVDLLLNVGVLGLLLWFTLILRGIARARKVNNTAAIFFGAAFLCYALANSLPWHVAPWLGILLTLQESARSSSDNSGVSQSDSSSAAGKPRR